ncbi:hypothetical protein H0A66_00030 [Alcaligenaceae bacterium]|nr:hypothetical protein [Alcaligenaceae bacterium]
MSYQNHLEDNKTVGIPILTNFLLVNTHETYLAIYCVLRLWECHHAEKTLFMRNFSKAWRQLVARQKEDQKTINAFVSVDAKTKLDKLRKIYRMPIGELLELLIEDEYKKHQHNSRKAN